jgi:membrane-associated phospholipid phosphatase
MGADYTERGRPGTGPRTGPQVGPLGGPLTLARAIVWFSTGVAITIATVFADSWIHAKAKVFQPGGAWEIAGDLRRELLFLQQYGAIMSLTIIGLAIYLLDVSRRRRLWDAAAAVLSSVLAVKIAKILVGRPRPHFDDPLHFCGPVRPYPLIRDGDPLTPGMQSAEVWRHSWEIWRGISADLWSMPSSHTAAAVTLSVILARLYPPLWRIVLPLAVVVGVCRVIFGAHYMSDVFAGATIGLVVSCGAMDHRWGQRVVARIRGRAAAPEVSAAQMGNRG